MPLVTGSNLSFGAGAFGGCWAGCTLVRPCTLPELIRSKRLSAQHIHSLVQPESLVCSPTHMPLTFLHNHYFHQDRACRSCRGPVQPPSSSSAATLGECEQGTRQDEGSAGFFVACTLLLNAAALRVVRIPSEALECPITIPSVCIRSIKQRYAHPESRLLHEVRMASPVSDHSFTLSCVLMWYCCILQTNACSHLIGFCQS